MELKIADFADGNRIPEQFAFAPPSRATHALPHFVLHATDLEHCPVKGSFTGAAVEAAIRSHLLATAEVSGRYSLYPPLIENCQPVIRPCRYYSSAPRPEPENG